MLGAILQSAAASWVVSAVLVAAIATIAATLFYLGTSLPRRDASASASGSQAKGSEAPCEASEAWYPIFLYGEPSTFLLPCILHGHHAARSEAQAQLHAAPPLSPNDALQSRRTSLTSDFV